MWEEEREVAGLLKKRKLLGSEEALVWSRQRPPKTVPISPNPLEQAHPPLHFERPHRDLEGLAAEFWDSQLMGDAQIRKILVASERRRRRPLPLGAINNRYEDPYSDELAETKVLSQKAVNFIVFSRSLYSSRQLAKKMSLEMNCVLIDPMKVIEEHYQKTSKGFYTPPRLYDKLKRSIFENNKRINEVLAVLKSLLIYYTKQLDGLEDWIKTPSAVVTELPESVQLDGRKSAPATPRSSERSSSKKLSGRSSKKLSKKNMGKLLTKQCEVSIRTLTSSEGIEPKLAPPVVEDIYSDVDFFNNEVMKSPELQDLICDIEKLPLSESEVLIDKFFRDQEKLLERLETLTSNPLLFENVAFKNFRSTKDILAKEIVRLAESFDGYTRGYVLVYDPLIASRDRNAWERVLSSRNPPDIFIFGQCPLDEASASFEALRVNPFFPYEYYNCEFMDAMSGYWKTYSCQKRLEKSELIELIPMSYRDGNIPIEESLVLEYCKVTERAKSLCQLSEMCEEEKVTPIRDELTGEYSDCEGTILTSYIQEDVQERIIDLKHYVRLPRAVLARTRGVEDIFFYDRVAISFYWDLPTSCLVRVDMRTPLCYQFSVIKRWFDYSGFYSKPRAISGSLALHSILCELLGLNRERVRLNQEFAIEYSQKMDSIKITSLGEGQHEEDEAEERVEEEEGTKLSSAMLSTTSTFQRLEEMEEDQMEHTGSYHSEPPPPTATVSSLSEFESQHEGPCLDEFTYLRRSFEGKLSYLADLKEQQGRDDPLFFHTYQCRLSTWEDRCPVAHHEGKCRRGSLDYSIRLHDKVYFFSTPQAQKAFQLEPAKYLLPLLPPSMCSVMLIGRENNATAYLAEAIATFFRASIIDYEEIIRKHEDKIKHKYIQSITNEHVNLLSYVFCKNIDSNYKRQCDKVATWLDKAYQLVLYRKLIFKPLYWDIHDLYDYPNEEMHAISEFYHPHSEPFDLNELFQRVQFKDLVKNVFFKTFEKYSDYSNIEPYFLEDCPEEVFKYDILLDAVLREQFKNMGLIDIYGCYDLCNFYSCHPYRLLERLPLDLMPENESLFVNQSEGDIRAEIGKFLFPLEFVPLTVKEKIDAIGTEIINIENEARHAGESNYGGWVIHRMPMNIKLLRRLKKCGLFPRNIAYVDDPDHLYKFNENLHTNIETRKLDIERNLACYVTPELRKSVYPVGLACFPLPENNKEITEPEIIQNLGRKVARFGVKFETFLMMRYYNHGIEVIEDWPGEKGLKNQLGRNYLYDQISLHPQYDPIVESSLKKELDLYELIYRKYGRSNFKPLESLTTIHFVTAYTFRSFLYDSEKFKSKKNHKIRILEMIDKFFAVYVEDNYTSECLELASFKFIHEEKQIKSSSTTQNFTIDFSYLYHLAYAIENSMLISHDLSDIFKNIYSVLKNLGYTFGIQQDFHPVASEMHDVSWEEKDRNRSLLYKEKKSRAQIHLIDYKYIVRKILEIERKTKEKKEHHISIEDLTVVKGKSMASDKISFAGMLSKVGTLAMKSLLEADSSFFISIGNHYKSILYFPQNVSFLSNEEKAYNLCVITNRIHLSDSEKDNHQDFSPLQVLLEPRTGNDWYFVKEEDYGDLLNFWAKENIETGFDLIKLKKNCYDKVSEEKGSHFLKKVISIQERIEKLRQRKSCYSPSVEEYLLLSYLIWIRDEYFRRYFIGFVEIIEDAYKSNKLVRSNFPNLLPKFSEFCKKYLSQVNKNSSNKEHKNYYNIWPFRSNYKKYPKFFGIYNCTIWNDISQIRKKRQKFRVNLTHPKNPSIFKTEDRLLTALESENEMSQEFIDFLLNDLKMYKYKSFLKEVKKCIINEKIYRIPLQSSKLEKRKVSEVFKSNSKNCNAHKGLLQKDGFQSKSSLSNFEEDLLKLQEVKEFVANSKVVTKMSWNSIDEFGPFNILYNILNVIKGPKWLPRVTNIFIPVEEECSETHYEGFNPQFSIKEEELKIECSRENHCIVSLFDGLLEFGLEGFSAEFFGKVYYFCSHECLTRFRLAPQLYVNISKALGKNIPFNVFYIELPGGLGKQIASLISYYFEINTFYLDDYLVQRYRKSQKDNDLRCISLKKKLITAYINPYQKHLEENENFLWSYLIQDSGAPEFKRIINELWKKGKHFCFYNFPFHKNNLRETLKKCVIPNILVITDLNCLIDMVGYKNIDFIKNYTGDLCEDRNRVTMNYFQDFKWWVANWQKRFIKTFKLIKREESSQVLAKLQFNLDILQKPKRPDFLDEKEISRSKLPLWSNTYFPILDGSDTLPSKSSQEQSLSDSTLFNESIKKGEKVEDVVHDNTFELLSYSCSELKESVDFKRKNDSFKNFDENINNCSYLKSSRFQLPYCCKWKPAFKSSFDYDDLKQIKNRVSFKKICQNMIKKLQKEIKDELDFRQKIKQTICSKKTFADDEANLKSEVLSIDSIGFEDFDNVNIDAEDTKKNNILWLLSVALKHTNHLNPFPVPVLDKYFEYTSPKDLNIFTDCQLETFDATVKQLQTCFDGVNARSFDFLNNDVNSLINSINESKSKNLYSECVQDIENNDVEKILSTGYYFLSKYGRQCPVKCKRGLIYPQVTIMYDSSNCYPVVHRRYIYFLSSPEALEAFKCDPLSFVDVSEYHPPIPMKVAFFGPNTKWTKYVINTLAEIYSLEHISVTKALEHFICKCAWSKLGQRLKWQTSFIYGLPYPEKLPTSLIWQAILSMISSPKSMTHGFIISGLAPNPALFQIWKQSNFKPHAIFFMTVDNCTRLVELQRQEIMQRFQLMGWKTLKFEYMKNSYLMSTLGCTNNEIKFWSYSNIKKTIAFAQRSFSNVCILNHNFCHYSVLQEMHKVFSNLIRNMSLLNKLVISEAEDPLPVGNFMPFIDFQKILNDCWRSECPVCICTFKRCFPRESRLFQPRVFLHKGKGFWICQKHTLEFVASPDEFTTDFNLTLNVCKRVPRKDIQINKIMFGLSGYCPVCYWIQQPHLEYQYRCGNPQNILFYDNKAYKFCSAYCYIEFFYAPWFYAFLGQCKIQTGVIPLLDTKHWSEPAMQKLGDKYLFIRDHKRIFFYNMLRLAANVDIFCPGLSKREARIFFIYILAKKYMSVSEETDIWEKMIVEFFIQCGISKKILKKYLNSKNNDVQLPNLLDYFISSMTI